MSKLKNKFPIFTDFAFDFIIFSYEELLFKQVDM